MESAGLGGVAYIGESATARREYESRYVDPICKLNGFQETVPLTYASLLNDPLFHFSSYNAIAHTYNSFQPPPHPTFSITPLFPVVNCVHIHLPPRLDPQKENELQKTMKKSLRFKFLVTCQSLR